MDFLCVLQTHTLSNSQGNIGHVRYGCNSKSEVVKRCARSLVASINQCKLKHPSLNYRLMVLDDHSDLESIEVLKKNLKRASFETHLEHLSTKGIMPSILACYERGRDHGKDLVYFAQDDYLFDEVAIEEMIDAYFQFTRSLGNHVLIYPFDDPYRYQPFNIHPVRVVHGIKRHWRTNFAMPSCFMTHTDVIRKEWDLLEAMGNHPVSSDMEDNTINRLMSERGYNLFTPIPSLALHFQFETEKDPYIDWKKWWNKWADPHITDPTIYQGIRPICLNIGSGNSKLDWPGINNYKEVRVDLSPECDPHVIDDIVGLSQIPDDTIDLIWACHVMEHIHWHQIPKTIEGFSRILKENGYAIIITPDLESIASMIPGGLLDEAYPTSEGSISPIDMIYGFRPYIENQGDLQIHRTGYTADSMGRILKNLGQQYIIVRIGHDLVTILYKGLKPEHEISNIKSWFGVDSLLAIINSEENDK
jgi:hypothetical protein